MRNELNPTSGNYGAGFEANPAAPNPAYNKPMTGRPPGRLQGDDLIGEVLRNMEEGLFRIRRKTLVPAIYRIYLNPEDYEPFRDVVPFIAGEIRTALDERLALWNRSPRKLAFNLLGKLRVGETPPDNEYVRMNDAWVVEIHPDLDGKLQPGEIEVYSELGAPQKAEYGAGSLTRRIFPQQLPKEAVDENDAAATVATGIPPYTSDQREPDGSNEDQTKGIAFAYLRYADQHGPQTFDVTKNQVVIGRGGRSYWVDLRLDTLPDVSREHCRIRRDPETGRFTVEDVSQFGTAVNGKPVGRNASADLPTRATISLAGVIDLQWEAA
jgi:FHA domain